METYSKEEVFDKIFDSFNYGNLGMFIGAGFSKAVVGNDKALGWLDIIKQASDSLKLDFPDDGNLIGVSLPELASGVCKQLAKRKIITYADAKTKFKEEISMVSSWLPDKTQIIEYRQILEFLNPSWIITTNYDLVLENLLTGKSKSLSPNEYLSAPKGIIPIYHFHGTRLEPESIIITQDDYIPLFRPNDYRQSKLALTIRESTTLIIGYSLGDTNVLSAVDWSRNIYRANNEYPHDIIQVLWVKQPEEKAYRDENNNIIFEISDLHEFLKDLNKRLSEKQRDFDQQMQSLESLIVELESNDAEMINKFITNENGFRLQLLEKLSQFENYMISSYIYFLKFCTDQVWSKTYEYGNFTAYNNYLCIIIDIVIHYDNKSMPPELFQFTAHALNRVLGSVDIDNYRTFGKSYDATKTWHNRKRELSSKMIIELHTYATANELHYLERFMRPLIILEDLV